LQALMLDSQTIPSANAVKNPEEVKHCRLTGEEI